VKYYKKSQLKPDVEYVQLTCDFILNLYDKAKEMRKDDKTIMMDHITNFSQHLNEYIEKPNKISLLKK
jgi:hypothetical protein